MKKIKSLLCLSFVLVIFFALCLTLISCNQKDNYKYLSVNEFGQNKYIIINNYSDLLNCEYADQIDISDYNNDFFNSKQLILFKFSIHPSENILTYSANREEHLIYLNVKIETPKINSHLFETGVEENIIPLLFEVEIFEGDMYYKEDEIMLLVENTNFMNKYRSIFYNCAL